MPGSGKSPLCSGCFAIRRWLCHRLPTTIIRYLIKVTGDDDFINLVKADHLFVGKTKFAVFDIDGISQYQNDLMRLECSKILRTCSLFVISNSSFAFLSLCHGGDSS